MIPISRKKRKKQHSPLLAVCIGILIFAGILGAVLLYFGMGNDNPFRPNRMPDNVSVAGISAEGKTDTDLKKELMENVSHDCEEKTMVVEFPGYQLFFEPEDTKAHWDIDAAVEAALSSTGLSARDIPLRVAFDKDYVRETLQSYADSLGGIYSPSGCWLEGPAPDPKFPEDPVQTLVISRGQSGVSMDITEIMLAMEKAYEDSSFFVKAPDPGPVQKPAPINLTQIAKQVSIDAVNPVLDRENMVIIPGSLGYGFDMEQAKLALSETQDLIVRVPMKFIPPEISEEDAWYPDVLGFCKTKHSDNPDRTDNLILACSMLDGIVLEPGDTLSYNETLGKRTAERGFKAAPAYSGTELVDTIGGGICQVSSTLYLASLFAEVSVTERNNHGFPVDYIPLGLDAAVNWGTTDLKLRNNSDHAVKLRAGVEKGYVYVAVMGIDTRDYTVKMEYRVEDPAYASAYICKYAKSDGELLSRKLHHTSIYLEEVWSNGGYVSSEDYLQIK